MNISHSYLLTAASETAEASTLTGSAEYLLPALIVAIAFTLAVSAFCSLLEAMILSTSTAEIETLKKTSLKRGLLLEKFREDIEETSSAILSLNTIANTLGATLSGGLFAEYIKHAVTDGEQYYLLAFSGLMTLSILTCSEIIPKNIGVLYRTSVQPHLVYPLWGVRVTMYPFSQVGKVLVRLVAGKKNVMETGDAEIILLAEKSAKEGTLTRHESRMITNALSLDEVAVHEIMTPRTVMVALEASKTVGQVLEEIPNVPFARMPVYSEDIDEIAGVVRRRDILKASAEDNDEARITEFMEKTIFIPEHATATQCLQQFLKSHQQLGVVVDEYGSVAGVVTMEDVIEHIIGQEIFEKDDMAIDMRELARKKKRTNDTAAKAARKTG